MSVDAATVSSFTFGYDVADEGGNQTGSLVQVRLVPIGDVNRPPVARPDVARTVSGQADRHPRPGQRHRSRRRRDPGRDDRRPTDVRHRRPSASDGTIRYSPRLGESGSDRLRYTVVDANGDRAVGEVVIGVLPADGENRAPTATERHLHRDRRQRHPAARRACPTTPTPTATRSSIADVDAGSDAVDHRPVGRDQLRATAHARRCRPAERVVRLRGRRRPRRHRPSARDGRGRRVDRSDRADRRRRHRRAVPRGQGRRRSTCSPTTPIPTVASPI